MHPRLALCVTALLALLGCANQPDVGGTTHVGKVQGLFVEEYPGVFVDQRLADASASGKPTWAHVKFAQPLADGRTFATAMVQPGQGVEPGDLVQMRFRAASSPDVAVVHEQNQVTGLIAKHGTAAARRFDGPEDRPLGWLSQAGG